jgi:hypothetical protein
LYSYLRAPFFATDAFDGSVDTGFVTAAAAGFAPAGAEVVVVVVVVGSGSTTGVTGVVGFGIGLATVDEI